MASERTDHELVEAVQAGQVREFGELYDRWAQPIYQFLYFKTWHRETAEDLAAQVFLKAFEAIRQFDADKGQFKSWLYRIAHNSVIDYYRTKKVASTIEDAWDLAGDTDIARDTEMVFELERVQAELAKLLPAERQIVIYRVWQGLSHAEIGELLGKSEDAAKVAFSRAIRKLKAALLVLALFAPAILFPPFS